MEASSAGKRRSRGTAPNLRSPVGRDLRRGRGRQRRGALTAALLAARGGASTVVVEKDEFFGGTTAVSGGDMWIPNNRFVKDRDSRAKTRSRTSGGCRTAGACRPELQEVYVDTAPEMFEYLLETTGYDSEPHIQLDDYYSVIGDRIPGVRHFRAPARSSYLAGRRARPGTRAEDRLGPVDPAAGDQLPRAAARPGRAEELAKRAARGLAGQGRRADRPAAQGRDRGRRRAARVHPRGRAGHRRRGRGDRRGRRGPGRAPPDRRPPRRRAGLRRLRPQPRDGQDVHRVRGQAGDAVRRTPATGTRWRWRSGPSSAR